MTSIRDRDPRERDPAYLGWVAQLPCVGCMALQGRYRLGVHVAHLRASSLEHDKRETGKGEKPSDVWTTPLCPAHHMYGPESQHDMLEQVWWERIGINPFDLCIALRAAYEAGHRGSTVISQFAAQARRAKLEGTAQ